jgi:thioredoxin
MTLPLVSDRDFESVVLRSELPVLVDLYADWCQPCKQLTPILESLLKELEGKLRIVRVDVEQSPNLAQAFRVQSIPMLVLLHKGRPVDQVIGLVDRATLLRLVKPVLPAAADEVAPQELAIMLTQQAALPVDLRDANSFGRYRIPGAIHIALVDIDARSAELVDAAGRLPVLYGRTTDEAKAVAERLRKTGVEVAFLQGGFLHWEAEGLEVERGAQ